MSAIKNKSQFVICGTDTDIGKTLISSFFVRGLNSFYWKPIQSGIKSETDSQAVVRLTKVNKAKVINEAYIFREPVSPHWASEIDQKVINFQLLNLPNVDGSLIVETAGGLNGPNYKKLFANRSNQEMGYPCNTCMQERPWDS